MAHSDELSSLDVGTVSGAARETGRLLLDAYYLQDEREAHLLRGDAETAQSVGAEALEKMAATFEREFPGVDPERARASGKAFMRALFLQDEIENWDLIRQVGVDSLSTALLSDPGGPYGNNQIRDERWDDVEAELVESCERAGIDGEFAQRQRQFWLLHGQLGEYWERVAIEAQEIKLRAMLPDPDADVVAGLADHFVAGVKLHDEWGHREKEEDMEQLHRIVSTYYQKIFELRTDGHEG